MKILSWMAIGRGKKHTLINTPRVPQVMIKPRLENIHCPCRDNSIPQPIPLLTNPASKFDLQLQLQLTIELFQLGVGHFPKSLTKF